MNMKPEGANFDASEATRDLLAAIENYKLPSKNESKTIVEPENVTVSKTTNVTEAAPQAQTETDRFVWSGRLLEGQTGQDVVKAQKNFDSAMRYLKSQETVSDEMIAVSTSMVITTIKVEDIIKTHSANDLEIRPTGAMVDNVPSTYSRAIMPGPAEIYAIYSRHDGAPLAYSLGEKNAKEFKQSLISAMSHNKEL